MKTRNIYKIVGEIELMNFDLEKNYKYHYGEDDRVVVDNDSYQILWEYTM